MSLFAELLDSETGEVLARVVDRRQARDTGQMRWSNRTSNRAEAARIASRWASILKDALDRSRSLSAS